jgi:hypothetical protein
MFTDGHKVLDRATAHEKTAAQEDQGLPLVRLELTDLLLEQVLQGALLALCACFNNIGSSTPIAGAGTCLAGRAAVIVAAVIIAAG